ncbi:hypothetical protein SPB21_12315 [Leptothoe sp. ISB3NOV94-8A]
MYSLYDAVSFVLLSQRDMTDTLTTAVTLSRGGKIVATTQLTLRCNGGA